MATIKDRIEKRQDSAHFYGGMNAMAKQAVLGGVGACHAGGHTGKSMQLDRMLHLAKNRAEKRTKHGDGSKNDDDFEFDEDRGGELVDVLDSEHNRWHNIGPAYLVGTGDPEEIQELLAILDAQHSDLFDMYNTYEQPVHNEQTMAHLRDISVPSSMSDWFANFYDQPKSKAVSEFYGV